MSSAQLDKVIADIVSTFGKWGPQTTLPEMRKDWDNLFADVKPNDTIAQEEIFGPVLAVIPYETEAEALEIANNSIYGLSAQVAAATNEEAYEFAKKIRTGTVSVNGGTWMHMDVPFGGFKQSGIGRQYGRQGFEEYLEIKVLGIPSGEKSKSLAWGEVEKKVEVEAEAG